MNKNIVEMTKDNFDQVIAKSNLLVIDFWAPWCAPCKDFSKSIESVAPRFEDVVFGKINIDIEKELAEEFDVRSIPAVMILRDQVVVYADSGALSPGSLIELLEQAKKLDTKSLKEEM